MKKLLSILPVLLLCLTAQAQIQKIIHGTYELDEVTEITLDLAGNFEVEFWASNNVLTETEIKLYDAKKHVLEFFINEKKRYEIKGTLSGDSYKLVSSDKKREGIAYKGVDCFEEVALTIYIPDSFEKVSDTVYKKKS